MIRVCRWVFLCVFFFVKQKTAYELRISDWSSDVCSSDLDHHRADELIEGRMGADPDEGDQRRGHRNEVGVHRGNRDADAPDPEMQIGRASCRDRVCQYV